VFASKIIKIYQFFFKLQSIMLGMLFYVFLFISMHILMAHLHFCKGWSPSLVLVRIQSIWFAGASLWSLATCPKRPSLPLQTM